MEFEKYLLALATIPPFDGLKREEINKFYSDNLIQFRSYDKGQIIHLQNEICDRLDVILEGRIAVQRIDENGNILTIQVFSGRDLLGANLIFASRNQYPMTVIADEKSVVALIPGQQIISLCQLNNHFMIAVLQAISDRTILLTDKIQTLALKSIRKSLLEFLSYESTIQQSKTIRLPMSKKALAEKLGFERSSLSRELNKMRRDGLVAFDAQTITLLM